MVIKINYTSSDVYVSTSVSPVYVVVNYSGVGGGGETIWGSITGTLSDQTDLQDALNAKFDDPTGTTSQYIRGDGSLATFPTIPSGTVTSVGLSMPSAFNVANSPVTSSGTLTVTGAGNATQYVRGDGQLATLPTGSSGGGASVSYYLNGSVNQGAIGGVTYFEMNRTPILGAGTDFTISSNGYIASFLTDANDPALLSIPGGNFNFETYFQASSGGGNPTFYVELYKYDGTTFTLIVSNSGSPKLINDGTNIEAYFSALAVPQTTLTLTDRLAIRIYVNTSGRTITLHTENNTLCQVITTFTTGLNALNGLTSQVQFFATGTSGTDFNINSASSTHTFNLPTASATNRGLLSSADWSAFNGKYNLPSLTSGSVLFSNGTSIAQDNANFFWDDTNNRLGIGTNAPAQRLDVRGNFILNTDGTSSLFSTKKAVGNDGNNIFIGGGGQSLATSPDVWRSSYNTALGINALNNITTSTINVAIGANAGAALSAGIGNTIVGALAASNITGSSSSNVIIGKDAGNLLVSGSNNNGSNFHILIGEDARSFASSNEIVIGYQARGLGNNRTVIGNSSITSTWLAGNLLLGTTTDSGQRLQVQGTSFFSDKLSIVKNELGTFDAVSIQNLSNSNTTVFRARDNGTGVCELGLYGTASIFPNDAFIYTNKLNFDIYANADRRLRIFGSTGNVVLQNGGTFTDGGQRLQVQGTTLLNGNVGVGTAPVANSSIRSLASTTTSTYNQIFLEANIGSSTTNYAGLAIAPITANATFSTFVQHIELIDTLKGAASTITEQYGILIRNLSSGNANYGIFGQVSAGNNKWNLYMNGTANNFMAGGLGIGTTSLAGHTLHIARNVTGATVTYGVANFGVVQSDVTTAINYFNTFGQTSAATFTLGEMTHYKAAQGTFGLGSTVTNQYGFFAQSNLTGATFNFGFRGDIPSGANRWNLYMNGTADNYLRGKLLINTTTVGTFDLDVNGTARYTGRITSTVTNDSAIVLQGNAFLTFDAGGGNIMSASAASLIGGGTTGLGIRYSIGVVIGTGTTAYHYLTNDYALFSSQSAAVNLSSGIPASAVLEARSTTKGFLPPRGTNTQMLAIASPATGLMFYDTTNNKLNCYDGTTWQACW